MGSESIFSVPLSPFMFVTLGLLAHLHLHPHLLCISPQFKVCPFKRICLDFPFRVKLTPMGCVSGKETWPVTGAVTAASSSFLLSYSFPALRCIEQPDVFQFWLVGSVLFSEGLHVLFFWSGPW